MKKIGLLFLCVMFVNCAYDDNAFEAYPGGVFLVEGKTFALKHYRIESRIDLNEDHLLWIDALESGQGGLISDLFFDDTIFFGCRIPSKSSMSYDNRSYLCLDQDGTRLNYEQAGRRIEIRHDDHVTYTAELTEHNTLLTFKIPLASLFERAFFEDHQFMNTDGFVEQYTGSATFIYELVD